MFLFLADTFNESNQLVMRTQWSIFLVGAGGFGGQRNTDKGVKVLPSPKRQPDAVIEEKTSIDQVTCLFTWNNCLYVLI